MASAGSRAASALEGIWKTSLSLKGKCLHVLGDANTQECEGERGTSGTGQVGQLARASGTHPTLLREAGPPQLASGIHAEPGLRGCLGSSMTHTPGTELPQLPAPAHTRKAFKPSPGGPQEREPRGQMTTSQQRKYRAEKTLDTKHARVFQWATAGCREWWAGMGA